ncbi:hypothetical protein LA080_000391 [Diaporthe eres]|uniref:HNH nuclease domain-containing protein n=1 Tax=Diaporthe vaccinii TaxID=105482 RepID=A0ABR4EEG2_9PEZI|nr:hypothetical protein LA080_000391 [Diaporthe eres]
MADNADDGVRLKSPAAFPPCISEPTKIEFLHPHYSGPDALFRLPRLDSTSSVPSGVHYRTALLACQIVANNAFHGYLATDRDGEARVTVSRDDDLLTHDKYWFIADANNPRDNYPVVPRFEDWLFPLDGFQCLQWRRPKVPDQDQVQPPPDQPVPPTAAQMPPPLLRPSTEPTHATSAKTRRCIISNVSYLIQSSHIIPQASESWFSRNYMEKFGGDKLGIHTPLNRVDMRHDLHNAWDRHMFALVPKQSELVVHVLDCSSGYGTCEFAAQWHNVMVRRAALDQVADEYLFAKFAQAIFASLKPFITRGFSRRIARLKASTDGDWKLSVDKVTGDVLKKEYGGGGTVRSSSASSGSRKRSHSQATQGDSNDAPDDHLGKTAHYRVHEWIQDQDDARDDPPSAWHPARHGEDLETEAERDRGRPRKRRFVSPRRDQTSDTLPSLVTDDNTSLDAHDPANFGDAASQPQPRYTLPPTTRAKSASEGREEYKSIPDVGG